MRITLTVLVLVALTMPILADDATADGPVLCTLAQIKICTQDDECKTKTADDLGLPRFVVADTKTKIITAVEENRQSKISFVSREDGYTVIQGFENKRAWSGVISDDGDLTLTASTEGLRLQCSVRACR